MTKNKLKPIDVSKYTVTDTGQVLKMNKEVEVIQRPTYAELKKENTELKEKLNNLASVAEERLANWQKYEKAYNEAEELLDKQIEATYKVVEENKELKEKLKPENCLKLLAKEGYIKFSSDQLTYAKTIIQDLLDNTDEYARQRAEDFLKQKIF